VHIISEHESYERKYVCLVKGLIGSGLYLSILQLTIMIAVILTKSNY